MNHFVSSRFSGNLGRDPLSDEALRHLAKSIFAEDKHESRSDRYAYIPTYEVLAGMRKEGFEPVYAKQGGSRVPGKADFTKHLIRFRHKGEAGTVRKVGGIYPEVVLVNSHDGTSAYKVMAGLMRLVCLNGLMVSDRELASVSVHHKGDVMAQVIEGSFKVLSESCRAVEAADAWSGVTLNHDEQMILAGAAHEIRFGEEAETPIEPRQLLAPRRRDDLGSDLWTVGNVVQENVIRGGLRAWGRDANGRRRRVSTREVKAIDADVKINRALWRLNEEMARLKGGGAFMQDAA
ncbi:DUF945 domain-containing protein [Novacetimonas maltaceti]|uniref:DUF945 domain-containing protein n=2 Tax=Acetobacteraceae TaxID=433 RepID=A0A2S3VXN2_9PROT|nr:MULTISPECIES: DUF932 domain-containing protein [Acetobacteraceae]POF61356.1 hypothetical protein KMAL_30100 [Novacetimonas maltaceti]PYD58017.1 DUF945 domain-containing protein [Novacetimonas maltaceti]CEF43052.1 conserved hypothetical protein [Acetobacter senegalensis]